MIHPAGKVKIKNPSGLNLFHYDYLYKSWTGYAFESICLKHASNVTKALGISGIYTQEYSFTSSGTETLPGAQIDLVIDRADRSVNLCEMKFYDAEFVISKEYARQLRQKREVFRSATKTRKHIFMTMISPYGVMPNEHSGLIDQSFSADILF